MGWSLGNYSPEDPELVDAALLSAGKALHLSTAFESKCHFVLQFLRLTNFYTQDPAGSYADAMALVAKKKMLGGTLKELAGFDPVEAEDADLLDKAREARNFIAHEGGLNGHLGLIQPQEILAAMTRLRAAVVDLAAGDHIVSRWVYMIEEKEPAGTLMDNYPEQVADWVFRWMKYLDLQSRLQAPSKRLRGIRGLRAVLGLEQRPSD